MWTQTGAIPSDKSFLVSSSWYRRRKEGHPHKENYLLTLGRKEEDKELFSCLLFLSLPSAQNSPLTKVAYFRVACSDPLCNLVQLPFTNEKTQYQREFSQVTEAELSLEPRCTFLPHWLAVPCAIPHSSAQGILAFPSPPSYLPPRLHREPVSYSPEPQIRMKHLPKSEGVQMKFKQDVCDAPGPAMCELACIIEPLQACSSHL